MRADLWRLSITEPASAEWPAWVWTHYHVTTQDGGERLDPLEMVKMPLSPRLVRDFWPLWMERVMYGR